MLKREDVMQWWINSMKEQKEIIKCIFYITVPKYTDIYEDISIKKIENILNRNHVNYKYVDKVDGVWNTNRNWIETDEVDCIVGPCGMLYCGHWKINDAVEFERMESNGEIMVLAHRV